MWQKRHMYRNRTGQENLKKSYENHTYNPSLENPNEKLFRNQEYRLREILDLPLHNTRGKKK